MIAKSAKLAKTGGLDTADAAAAQSDAPGQPANSLKGAAKTPLSPRRLLAAVAANSIGDGVVVAVIPLLAASLSPSAGFVGVALFCARLPWLVVSMPAGRTTDRRGANFVSRVGAVIRCFGLAALACAGLFRLQVGLLVAAFLYVTGQVSGEVATQTAILDFPASERPRINGNYNAAQTGLGQFAGPTLGGILNSFGVLWYSLAAGMAQALAAIFLQPWWATPRRDGSRKNSGVLEGFRSLWADRGLKLTTVIGAISMFAYGAWGAVFVLYVTRHQFLHESSAVYGILLGVPAIGVMIGTRVMPTLLGRSGGQRCMWAMVVGQFGLYFPGAAGLTVWGMAGGLLFYGLGLSGWNTGVLAYRQANVAPAVYGRATAAYRLISWGASPLGALAGGILAAAAGVQSVLELGLALVALQCVLALIPTSLREFFG